MSPNSMRLSIFTRSFKTTPPDCMKIQKCVSEDCDCDSAPSYEVTPVNLSIVTADAHALCVCVCVWGRCLSDFMIVNSSSAPVQAFALCIMEM